MPDATPAKTPMTPQDRVHDFLDTLRIEPDQEKQKEVARREVERMTREELDALRAEVEKGADLPKALEEQAFKLEIMEKTRTRLDALRLDMEKQAREGKSGPATTEQGPGFMKSVDDTLAKVPYFDKLTPEQRRITAGVTVGLGILAAYGAYRIAKSWKAGKSAAQEQGKKGGGFFKKLLVGLGIGAAVFLGIKVWNNLSTVEKAKEIAGGAIDTAQQTIDALQKKLDELKGKSAPTPEEVDQTRELAEKLEEAVAAQLAMKAFTTQYDIARKIGVESPTKITHANEIVTLAREKNITMRPILACIRSNNDAAYRDFLREVYPDFDRASRDEQKQKILSAKFVVGFVEKNLPLIEKSKNLHGQELDGMRFAAALNIFTRVPGFLSEAGTGLALAAGKMLTSGELPDIKALTKDLFENKDIYADAAIELALMPLREREPGTQQEKEAFRKAAADVAALFLTNKNVTVAQIENLATAKWPGDQERIDIAVRICKELASNEDLKKKIVSAALVPANGSERSDQDKRVASKLEEILKSGNLSLSDAFQLYYLSQSGNGGLLTFKTLDILGNERYIDESKGERQLAIDRYHEIIDRMIEVAIEDGEEGMEKIARQYGWDERMQIEMGNIISLLEEKIGHAAREFYDQCIVFAQHHPYIATTVLGLTIAPTAVTGGLLTLKGMRIWRKVQWSKIYEMTKMSVDDFAKAYRISDTAKAAEVQKALQDVLTEKGKLDQTFDFFARKEKALLRESKATMRGAQSAGEAVGKGNKALEALAKAGLSEKAADTVKSVAFSEDLVRTLNKSPKLANALAAHLNAAENPVGVLSSINKIAGNAEALEGLSKTIRTEKDLARLVQAMDAGRDVTGALSRSAKIMRVAKGGIPVVLDGIAIVFTVMDIAEKRRLIENTPESSVELRNAYETSNTYNYVQLGVAGTGVVAGGLAIAGVGAVVAAPVALLTLPVGAVVAGIQASQSQEEDWARNAEDWARENDVSSLLYNLQHFTTGESINKSMNMLGRIGEWMTFQRPENKKTIAEEDIEQKRDMLRAVVLKTTYVGVPKEVMGDDNAPRPLTPDEHAMYKGAANTYVEAKVDYMIRRNMDDLGLTGDINQAVRDAGSRGISYEQIMGLAPGTDIAQLLQEADDYAMMKQAEYCMEKQGLKKPDTWPEAGKSQKEQAQEYGAMRVKESVDAMYFQMLLMLGESPGNAELAQKNMSANLQGLLFERCQSVITDFQVRALGENYVDGWPDSNEGALLNIHTIERGKEFIKNESDRIANITANHVSESLNNGSDATGGAALLSRDVELAFGKISDLFLRNTPRQMWEAMDQNARAKATEKLQKAQREKPAKEA